MKLEHDEDSLLLSFYFLHLCPTTTYKKHFRTAQHHHDHQASLNLPRHHHHWRLPRTHHRIQIHFLLFFRSTHSNHTCILIGTGLWTLAHGFTIGKARLKYANLAKKDGEPNVDERYLLPNLYAQGTSKHVRAFNCIQRSHQQIFETFTTVVLSGIMGCISFPICTALSTFTYAIGRYQLSKGYAEAAEESSGGGPDASKRYKYPLAKFMWYGFLCNVMLGMGSCGLIIGGMKTFG